MRRALCLLACSLLTACAQHDGRLLVVVSSDMAAPGELAHIEVRTERLEGGGRDSRGFPVDDASTDVRRHLPLSFAVAPNGRPSVGVEIVVEGYGPGDVICTGPDEPAGCRPRVSRTVRTGFSANITRVVDVFLARACRDVSCPGRHCARDGSCEPIRFTPPGELPILEVPGGELDATRPDAGMDAPTDTSGLDVPAPDVPGLDAPDDPDVPFVPMDVPGPDAPGFVPGELAVIYAPVPTAGAQFGTSVALGPDGELGLIGEPLAANGRAYVLEGTGLRLGPPLEPAAGVAQFGSAVALGGRGAACRALVGAPDSPAVVYPYDCATWSQGAPLVRSSPGIDSFGSSVAISTSGAEAIVGGAVLAGPMGSGSAWRFGGAGWDEFAVIALTDGQMGDALGRSVAIDGTGARALIGVPFRDAPSVVDHGATVALTPSGAISFLPATSTDSGFFGSHVALSDGGSTALVSAVGRALAFRRMGETWGQLGGPLTEMGLIGTPTVGLIDDDDALLASSDGAVGGVLRWFHWDGAEWRIVRSFTSLGTGDGFGSCMAVSRDGRRALVGAPLDSTMGAGAGAVHLYALAP